MTYADALELKRRLEARTDNTYAVIHDVERASYYVKLIKKGTKPPRRLRPNEAEEALAWSRHRGLDLLADIAQQNEDEQDQENHADERPDGHAG